MVIGAGRQGLAARVAATIARRNSALVLGLDPDQETAVAAERHCRFMLEQVLENACGVKLNLGFFLRYGNSGIALLERLREVVGSDWLYILDAKVGDISNSSAAYAEALYGTFGADIVTVNPLLGGDAVAPFLQANRAAFLLARTSNPGAADFLDAGAGEEPLFTRIVRTSQGWENSEALGYVVGATTIPAIAAVRAMAPEAVLLLPGIGIQGGDLEGALRAGLDKTGDGVLIPMSRSLSQARNPKALSAQLREQINGLRQEFGIDV